MAIAGLHNVSVFDSSFLLESQDRPSTRAASVLQMWRELEGEHVVSHPNARFGERVRPLGSETSDIDHVSTPGSVNGNDSLIENESGLCSHSLIESENEHEDNNSVCSEQSIDLGEVERERVRQIFSEWMKNGAKSHHTPNVLQRNNRSKAQCLRENECGRVRITRDEGVAEIADGLLVHHREVAERKPIRKLCGRQALLDMVMRDQRERKKELQDLSVRRPVAQFAHRNRIQSLLKGRFLLNQRVVHDERPTSTAASELGLLTRKHTVSHLREGFLSKLDCSSANGVQSTPSNDEYRNCNNEQSQSSNEPEEVQDEIYNHQAEPDNAQREINEIDIVGNIQHNTVDDVNQQESDSLVIESQGQVSRVEEEENETSSIELISSEHGREDDSPGSWRNNLEEWSARTSDAEGTGQTHLLEDREMYNENDAQSIDGSHVYGFENSMTEAFAWPGMPARLEDWQESEPEHDGTEMQQFAREWTEVNGEGIGGSWQEGADQLYPESSGNDVWGYNHFQESAEWHENVQQDTIDSLSDVPARQEDNAVGRFGSLYFPDEENIREMELRQLLSRRRVSTLLDSGFRENLNQLIQSYVQRQNNASVDWELDEDLSSPYSDNHDQEQQHNNQEGVLPPRNQELLQAANWPHHNHHQRIGNEWEVINEMRIDMARLHQRMDNMQRMLEACMEMQSELQRSVRQEVSAALNRSDISANACEVHLPMDDIKLEQVKKGICCMCSEKKIDSLLYRCGHMSTCLKCAEKLVQGGKCPMCRAPVTEVIRAYFIQ